MPEVLLMCLCVHILGMPPIEGPCMHLRCSSSVCVTLRMINLLEDRGKKRADWKMISASAFLSPTYYQLQVHITTIISGSVWPGKIGRDKNSNCVKMYHWAHGPQGCQVDAWAPEGAFKRTEMRMNEMWQVWQQPRHWPEIRLHF